MITSGVRPALVAAGVVAFACGLAVGVNDNPPGIALIYSSMICIVLAAVVHWRQPKSYLMLLALSALGFVVLAILHNVFYGLGELTGLAWLKAILGVLNASAFLIALLVCPAGVVIGLVGWVVTVVRSRRSPDLPAAG